MSKWMKVTLLRLAFLLAMALVFVTLMLVALAWQEYAALIGSLLGVTVSAMLRGA